MGFIYIQLYPKKIIEENYKQIDIEANHLKLVKNALYKVVNEQKGTAFKSRSNLYKYSGKTGTSQVKKITIEERDSDDFRKKILAWQNRDHALFVGYMPAKQPKYAISVIIEHGGSGSKTAAPIAKKLLKKVIDRHSDREKYKNNELIKT